MRTVGGWLVLVLAAAGCGDQNLGLPHQTLVPDLEPEDAIELCVEFVANLCGDANFESFCNPCVVNDLCTLQALVNTMNIECAEVTVGEVRDCAQGRTEPICLQGGGCMIDVGEALCHP